MTLIHKVSSDWDARIWFDGTGWAERRLEVTPAIAGWDALSFRTYTFRSGQVIDGESAEDEMAMVLLSGAITMEVAGWGWSDTWSMRGRDDVFDGPPFALYLPPHHTYKLTVHADADCAYGRAPATGARPPRLIRPNDTENEPALSGVAQVTRIFGAEVAEHLVCAQVVVPGGAWAFVEPGDPGPRNEVIYVRTRPRTGWAVQRLIGPDSEDQTFAVRHGDATVVRSGVSPLGAGPATDVYALQFVARGATVG